MVWSEALQSQTKEYFKKMPIACMKHFDDLRFGVCVLLNGEYIIIENSTQSEYKFDSVEALIEKGWAID
jgi:hypothetical protein